MARKISARQFVRPPQRTKIWIGAGVGLTSLVGNSKQIISTLSVAALLLRPFTILRTRMLLTLSSDQAAADERPIVAYGKMVVTETAAALGATAVPDPSGISGDPEAAWYVWQAMSVDVEFQSAIGFALYSVQYPIDSKSMRKVGPDDDVVSVTAVEAAPGAILTTHGRMLLQLH